MRLGNDRGTRVGVAFGCKDACSCFLDRHPGLRPLRSLTLGYHLAPFQGSELRGGVFVKSTARAAVRCARRDYGSVRLAPNFRGVGRHQTLEQFRALG